MQNNYEKVKEKVPLYHYIETHGYNIKRNGVDPAPCCGHNNCFKIHPHIEIWKCFSCGKKGDVLDFMVETQAVGDRTAALHSLANEYNVPLVYSEEEKKRIKLEENREPLFIDALKIYQKELKNSKTALEYLYSRGRTSETIENEFKYGYSGKGGLILKNLIKKYSEEELISSGLVIKDDNGTVRDYFTYDFIIYPIYLHGKLCSFYGKRTKKEPSGRAVELRLYKEASLKDCDFYGENYIYGDCFLVEGHEDRNSLIQSGIKNAVAIQGGISDHQLDKLKRGKGKLYLCFDMDDAGQKFYEKVVLAVGHIRETVVIDLKNVTGLKSSESDEKEQSYITGQAYIDYWQDKVRRINQRRKEFPVKDIDDYCKLAKFDKRIKDHLISFGVDGVEYIIKKINVSKTISPIQLQNEISPHLQLLSFIEDETIRIDYLSMLIKHLGKTKKWQGLLSKKINTLIQKRDESDKDNEEDDSPVERLNLVREGNCYTDKGSGIKLTDFVFTIKRKVQRDNIVEYCIVLTNTHNESTGEVYISGESRVNIKKFAGFASNQGRYYFLSLAKDYHITQIWQLEEERAGLTENDLEVRRYGFLKNEGVWLFENAAIVKENIYLPNEDGIVQINGRGYKSFGVKVYGGDTPQICLSNEGSIEFVHKVIELFWKMLDAPEGLITPPYSTFRAFLCLGYVAATVYSNELTEVSSGLEKAFPFLSIYGPSGTGKSEVAQFIMNIFGFRSGGENWGQGSVPGLNMAMEQLSSLPFWAEEYKNTFGRSNKQNSKVEILNNMYNRTGSGKGGLLDIRKIYEVNATLLLTGQDCPNDKALFTKIVKIPKQIPNSSNTAAYNDLKSIRDKLSLVLRYLIATKTPERVKEVIDNINSYKKYILNNSSGLVDSRAAHNLSWFAGAFSAYDYHEQDEQFMKFLLKVASEDMKRKGEEDIVIRFFNDMETVFSDVKYNSTKENSLIFKGQNVYMAFYQMYQDWMIMQTRTSLPEYLGPNVFREYLKTDPIGYWVDLDGDGREYFGSPGEKSQKRAICLNVEKLPAEIKAAVVSWRSREGVPWEK